MNPKLTGLKRLLRQDAMLVGLALGCGIGGAWLAKHYLEARVAATEARLASRYTARAVVVAAQDVAAGEVLQQAKLAARSMPQEFLPPDAVPVERAAELLGGKAAIDIRRGTPIVPAVLRTGPAVSRLSSRLAVGERALTVPVDEVSSHAGAVAVGDRVDVYYRPGNSSGGQALLMPLLQQVEVLAIGSSFLPPEGSEDAIDHQYGTVTLRVAEAEAARLLLAQAAGELALLLRAPGDAQVQAAVLRSSRELLQMRPTSPVRRIGTEVLTGGNGGTEPVRTWLSVGIAAERPGETS